MVESEGQLLPVDWRDREDGLELVFQALAVALSADVTRDLAHFAELGREFSANGLEYAAVGIANAIALRLLPVDLRYAAGDDLTSIESLERLLDLLRGQEQTDELYGALLTLAATILRESGRTESACAAYSEAATVLDRLGLTRLAAANRQSLGATLYELGDSIHSDEVASLAIAQFEAVGDRRGVVATTLNRVEYALSREDVRAASDLLSSAEAGLSGLRDGELRASLFNYSALIDIRDGDVASARSKFLSALRSARRRADREMQLTLLQNLAKLTRDTIGPEAAIPWARRAFEMALDVGNVREQQSFARSLAVDLNYVEQFDEAADLLRRAAALNANAGHVLEQRRTEADLGATYLARALVLPSTNSDEKATLLAELGLAEAELREAFESLHAHHDAEWGGRAARNLRVAWVASDRADFGASYLAPFADEARGFDSTYASDLFRHVGLLLFATGEDHSAIEAFETWRQLANRDANQTAAALASDAATVRHNFANASGAVLLYDLALAASRGLSNPVSYASTLNDSALVCADLGAIEEARGRLLKVKEIAEESGNRVLLALAENNLGEVAFKTEDVSAARAHLYRSAALSEQIGDITQAARAIASIANSLAIEPGQLEDARHVSQRALELAERSGSDDALARALSAQASVAFADANFESAHKYWRQAARAVNGEGDFVYQCFALESLAAAGNWQKFSRELDQVTRAAQRTSSQLDFAQLLWRPARTWLMTGWPRRAAKPIAYSIALAGEGFSRSMELLPTEGYIALRERAMTATAMTFAAAHTLIELADSSPETAGTLEPQVLSALAKIAGTGSATLAMETVHSVAAWGQAPDGALE